MKQLTNFLILIVLLSCSGNTDKTDQDGSDTANNDRPNVIFMMADDHTSQAISAYGGILADVAPTPNIDRLAEEGMLFNNTFVTNSICTPSRAAIMTGKYSHKNGVYTFTALDQSQTTLPKIMQEAGYQTALIGKYHLRSNPVGLDYYSVLPGQGRYNDPQFLQIGDEHPNGIVGYGKRTQFKGHSTDVIADQILDYLKNKRNDEEPFMLFAHFKAPHDPWTYAERYEDYLADEQIPEPTTLFDDYEGRADALKKQHQYIGSSWGRGYHTNFPEETGHLEGVAQKKKQYQLYIKKYLRSVKGVDDNVGRILDYLDESGLAENTIIMYTGDQGFYLGEHGMYDKRFMYEEALRMPFLVRWPQKVEQQSVSDGMILNVDFAPTIMDAVGLQPDTEMQGRSFMPLLQGELPSNWRESMYYRYYYSHFYTEPHYGVRTYDHKLIHYDRIDQWELYDLNEDPTEMNNLYNDPEHQSTVADLKDELKRLQNELGDIPEDNGNNPRLGEMGPHPLHVSNTVKFVSGDKSVLVRFKTDVGGTLFSISNLEDNPYNVDYSWDGNKTLYINNSNLIFSESGQSMIVEENVADNEWHTVAFVMDYLQPLFYLDGQLVMEGDRSLTRDKMDHSFNIGAGLEGYNFIGDISDVRIYDEELNEQDIQKYSNGENPNGRTLLEWEN